MVTGATKTAFPRFWETPELTQIGRLPARATLFPFSSEESALQGDPFADDWCLSLDGVWDFQLFPSPGLAMQELSEGGDSEHFKIAVPGCWNMQGHDRNHYTNVKMPFENDPPNVPNENPTGMYRKRFQLPKHWAGRRTIVQFGGAESCLCVYLNGQFIGMSKDSRLPAEFDLTEQLRSGSNVLSAMVIRWSDGSYVEDQDQWWMAGLQRSVFLYSTDYVRIQDVKAETMLTDDFAKATLRVTTKLDFAEDPMDQVHHVRYRLLDPEGEDVWKEPLETEVSGSYRVSYYEGTAEGQVSAPCLWSDESPSLYSLLVILTDGSSQVIECTFCRIGFRRIEVRDREVLLNGNPVLFKGVNRHEHHDLHGKAVPRETMMQDILLLKQFHFNAVRCSHYPNDPHWYDLCDEYGILLIDEANLECHANYESFCRDPRWERSFYERGTRMVERDKNHPCVIAWSLGNEAGYGAHQDKLAVAIRLLDSTRLVVHEGSLKKHWCQNIDIDDYSMLELMTFEDLSNDLMNPGGERSTDVTFPMYTHWNEVKKYALESRDTRPLILSEYSHAMGNSNGGLKEYWDMIWEHEGIQGGFIWDWVDQGLLSEDERGNPVWVYGGDCGDNSKDVNFCINGMIWPDRTPHPAMYEFKKLAQPIRISRDENGELSFFNGNFVQCIEGCEIQWRWETRGRIIESGQEGFPVLAPRDTYFWNLHSPNGRSDASLYVSVVVLEASTWHEAGFKLAWEQFVGPTDSAPVDFPAVLTDEPPPAMVDEAGNTSMDGDLGDVIRSGPSLHLVRGWLDNDGVKGQPKQWRDNFKPLGRWMNKGLGELTHICRGVKHSTNGWKCLMGTRLAHTLEPLLWSVSCRGVHRSGLLLEYQWSVPESLADLPRLGVRLELQAEFDQLEWYGLGPHESYRDRKTGCYLGRFSGTVEEQYIPYILPQEHGNKEELRWLSLRNRTGNGILIFSDRLFSGSASWFRTENVIATKHTCDLKRSDAVQLHLDAFQRGLGTASCGPDILRKDTLQAGEHSLKLYLIPIPIDHHSTDLNQNL